jgi:hypothetical protein
MSEAPANPTTDDVLTAAADALREKPGGRIFVYVDHGTGTEPAVFASGDDETAADLLLAVGEWLDLPYPEEDDD